MKRKNERGRSERYCEIFNRAGISICWEYIDKTVMLARKEEKKESIALEFGIWSIFKKVWLKVMAPRPKERAFRKFLSRKVRISFEI